MSTTGEFFAREREMRAAILGEDIPLKAGKLMDIGELLLTLADILDEKGDIHGAIEIYEKAMKVSRTRDRF